MKIDRFYPEKWPFTYNVKLACARDYMIKFRNKFSHEGMVQVNLITRFIWYAPHN